MASSTRPFDIAIVGGGIAGITLCISLVRGGIPVTLYESANAFGEIGAGVALGPNAARAMARIDPGVFQGFENVGTGNQSESKKRTWFDFRRGVGLRGGHRDEGQGDLIYSLGGLEGGAAVHRAHFLDELVKLVPPDVSKFGKRLKQVEETDEGVRLHFLDGTSAAHSAVVGADGIKSQTRKTLLGEDDPAATAVFSGKYAYRGLIPMDKAVELLGDELARNSQMYFGYHGHLLTFPVSKGRIMNVVAFSSQSQWEDEQWVVSTTKETLYKDFEGWSSHVQNILHLMQNPDIWALFEHLPARTYTRGRLCLIGDAAHATTPHQGAGAGMAIEDAYVLGEIVKAIHEPAHLVAAFRAYEKVRLYRTQKLVATSHEAGMLYDFELDGIGDDASKIAESLSKRMRWIWDEDLEQEVRDAKAFLEAEVKQMYPRGDS